MSMTLQKLRDDVTAAIGRAVTDDENLLDGGLDSVRLMLLAEQWRAGGAHFTFLDLFEEPTIAAWSRVLGLDR